MPVSIKDIRKEVFGPSSRVDEKYIGELLRDELGLQHALTKEGKQGTVRYSYWRTHETHEADGVNRRLQEVKSTFPQRPYVFPRDLFVSSELASAEQQEEPVADTLPF